MDETADTKTAEPADSASRAAPPPPDGHGGDAPEAGAAPRAEPEAAGKPLRASNENMQSSHDDEEPHDPARIGQTAPPAYGVPNLNRANVVPDGFSFWHWAAQGLSGSDVLSGSDLDPAAAHMRTGDVIFITTDDGVLQRSIRVVDDVVGLARVA